MKLGVHDDLSSFTEQKMSYLKQLGVNNIIAKKSSVPGQTEKQITQLVSKFCKGDYWRIEDLAATKKWVESCGLEVSGIAREVPDKVILGLPGRDEQIENWCKSLRNMGKAGIPLLRYGMWTINAGSWLSNWRTTASTVGRGGAKYVSFDYEVAKDSPVSELGQINDDQLWNSLTYFLKAVIPVAAESGVKMVLHPADPQVPSLAGIARIIRSVEAYDRVFKIVSSDYNCMIFCLGCFTQMLGPEGVYDAIKHFGRMGKIGTVHFRNIKGNLERFDEVYPDEGRLDMVKAIELLNEVGFKDTITLDHVPHGTFDTEPYYIGYAFQIGYLKGLLQSASALD